tara:strand:+ start:391 stop:894 length:504 start_codon:yes stop_codon:yes gene_type:complete
MKMTEAKEWLKKKSTEFRCLCADDLSAITDFFFLWSLFEFKILKTNANVAFICAEVSAWEASKQIDATMFKDELAYFCHRYYAEGSFTGSFNNLNFGKSDRECLVRDVISKNNEDPKDCLSAALIIVYRYRNNLFHGGKWEYNLKGQLDNFRNANSILMKVMDEWGL